jgi:hypothetical protein
MIPFRLSGRARVGGERASETPAKHVSWRPPPPRASRVPMPAQKEPRAPFVDVVANTARKISSATRSSAFRSFDQARPLAKTCRARWTSTRNASLGRPQLALCAGLLAPHLN